jgi:glutamine amidotransferase-like uncharacterized protein
MFEWMNASVSYVQTDAVDETALSDCDILVVPGGSELTYSTLLGEEGRRAVVDFVSNGGSYFGICGGSTVACRYGLGLLDGTIVKPVPGVSSGTYMIQLDVNRSCLGPDLSDQPANVTTLYWESCYFSPANWTGIHPVTKYHGSEYSPMIAFQYKSGSVFLSSPHPEYEEDDDRDGTAAFDHLEDPDSEWTMLLKVACWLVDVSPAEPQEDYSVLVLGVVIAGAVATAVILIAQARFSK